MIYRVWLELDITFKVADETRCRKCTGKGHVVCPFLSEEAKMLKENFGEAVEYRNNFLKKKSERLYQQNQVLPHQPHQIEEPQIEEPQIEQIHHLQQNHEQQIPPQKTIQIQRPLPKKNPQKVLPPSHEDNPAKKNL